MVVATLDTSGLQHRNVFGRPGHNLRLPILGLSGLPLFLSARPNDGEVEATLDSANSSSLERPSECIKHFDELPRNDLTHGYNGRTCQMAAQAIRRTISSCRAADWYHEKPMSARNKDLA
jgi:hypothetical protein